MSLAESLHLELPDRGGELHAQGVIEIAQPEAVSRAVFHIPVPRVFKVFSKVNAVGTGIVQTVRARKGEVVCELDLARYARRYAFGPGENTLELKIIPQQGAEPVYASWVVIPSGEALGWEGFVPAAEKPPAAGYEGLEVMAETPGGLQELQQGATVSRRLVVRARFAGANGSAQGASLSVRWQGGGLERSFEGVAAGGSPHLQAAVELAPGSNRLEVEVRRRGELLERREYRVLRREPSRPEIFTGEKWAVVIGISDYRHDAEIEDLRFAHRDAKAIRDFLVSPAGGAFGPERVKLLLDDKATNREIRTALFSFLADTRSDDLVFIFFAGHGFADPKNPDNFFLAAHDSEYDNLGGTALPMWDLQSVMDFTIRARRVVVLADACHSGALARQPGRRGVTRFNLFSKYLQALGREEGRLVLTASRVYEPSQERQDWGGGHGVFTYSVLEGLRGEADVDHDGVVTAGELLDYVRFMVPKETRGEQHPDVQEAGFNRSFPLAAVGVADVTSGPVAPGVREHRAALGGRGAGEH